MQVSKDYVFTHITSSPQYPQSNGAVERAVQTVKNIIKKNEDVAMGLLCYRTTPLHNGFSPAELLMGRRLRTNLPMLPSKLSPAVPNPDIVRQKENLYKDGMKTVFDQRHGVHNLPSLNIGDQVYVPDTAKPAVIIDGAGPRSYKVETPDGAVIRRNRRALNAAKPPQQEPPRDESQAKLPQSPGRVPAPVSDPVSEQKSTAGASVSDSVPSSSPVLRRSTQERLPRSRFVPD